MESVFLTLLNMSITASWTALAVILLRLLLKKSNKALTCALWALVGLRLVCPISLESVLSLIPSAQTVPQEILYAQTPAIDSGVPIINNTFNPVIAQSMSPQPMTSVNPMQVVVIIATNVWVIGMIAMLLYVIISYLHIRRKTAASLPMGDNVYLCDNIGSPFILGVIRPRIYLPSTLADDAKAYVIAHEQAHLKRRDHWWKPLGFLLLSVYWFNPVMWVAYVLLCRDIEFACDERVVKDMDKDDTAAYAEALLCCSAPRKIIAACPLAFGEVGVKNRIKAALHYKKPAFWITVIAIVASIVLTVCFLTNPSDTSETKNSEFDGLRLAVDSFTMTETGGELTIRWHNDSDETLMFGESFTLYREENGQYIDCYTLEEAYFHTIGYELPAGRFRDHTYDLSLHDLSTGGMFRFESYCTVSDGDGKKYRVWIDFEIPEDALTPPATPYITYTMFDSDAVDAPSISLSEDGRTFWFNYSMFSSHIGHGSCESIDETLFLYDDNGDTYVFAIDNDTLIFDADRSSPLPTYQLRNEEFVSVPDGAVFNANDSSTTTTTAGTTTTTTTTASVSAPSSTYHVFTMLNAEDPVPPSIAFSQDGHTFWLFYSNLSDYVGHGRSEKIGSTMFLYDENGNTYIFIIKSDTLCFEAKRSSPFPADPSSNKESADVPNNAIFKKINSSDTTKNDDEEQSGSCITYDPENNYFDYYGPYILNENVACIVADAVFLQKDPTLSKDYPTIQATYHADTLTFTVNRTNAKQEVGASLKLLPGASEVGGMRIKNVMIRGKSVSSFAVTTAKQAQVIGDAILSSVYGIYGRSDKPLEEVFPILTVERIFPDDSNTPEWLVMREDADENYIMMYISPDGSAFALWWYDVDTMPINALVMPEWIEIDDYNYFGDENYTIIQESHNVLRIQKTRLDVREYTLNDEEIAHLNQLYASITDFGSDETVYIDGSPVKAENNVFIRIDGEDHGYMRGHARQPQLDEYIDLLISYYQKGVTVWD